MSHGGPLFPQAPEHLDPRDWPEMLVYAATVYLEAAGEPKEGQQAVAWVIRHRMDARGEPGPAAVCLAPLQFSCWDAAYEPERTLRLRNPLPETWTACWRASVGAYFGILPDLARGADHYLNPDLTRKIRPTRDLPPWYDANKVVAVIGRHEFLRLDG